MALTFSFAPFKAPYNPEAGIVLVYLMGALSFPSSILVMPLLGAILMGLGYFSIVIPGGYIFDIVVWLCLFIVGYLQWFKLLPFLWMKLSAK